MHRSCLWGSAVSSLSAARPKPLSRTSAGKRSQCSISCRARQRVARERDRRNLRLNPLRDRGSAVGLAKGFFAVSSGCVAQYYRGAFALDSLAFLELLDCGAERGARGRLLSGAPSGRTARHVRHGQRCPTSWRPYYAVASALLALLLASSAAGGGRPRGTTRARRRRAALEAPSPPRGARAVRFRPDALPRGDRGVAAGRRAAAVEPLVRPGPGSREPRSAVDGPDHADRDGRR